MAVAESNLATIINFLLGKGLTPAQAAGVAGNFKIESGYSPTAYNANENAIGLAQWQRGRRTALQAFAAKAGGRETDLMIQLQFLWHELTGSESAAFAALKATTTAHDAAAVFDQKFERSSGAARAARQSTAASIYQQITSGTLGTNPGLRSGGSAFVGSGEEPGFWDTVGLGLDAAAGGLTGGPGAIAKLTTDPTGMITGGILGPIFKMATVSIFVIGGGALVVVGLAQAIKPAAAKAARGAQTVIQTVKPAA